MPNHTIPRTVEYVCNETWTNWAANQTCTPAYTFQPRSEDEVLDAVRFAIGQRLPVRAVGAGHSSTPIVQTGGVLIHTDALTGLTDVDTARRRVRVRGGTHLSDLGDAMWEHELAMPNQGDAANESIAGVLATAAHGSGLGQTSVSARLRGARIVTGLGEIVEIDERDVQRLRAAQVAIGTLGIMTEVELEVSPRYYLQEEISYPQWDQAQDEVAHQVATARHYSFLWCPHDRSPDLYELPCPAGLPMANRTYQKVYREVDVTESGGLVSTARGRIDRSYRIFDAGGMSTPFHELEYGVPAEQAMPAIAAMQRLMQVDHPDQRYPLEVRWVKADDAYLSPFHRRDTCVLSVSGAPGSDYWPYLRDVDALLSDFDARPHWGKLHFLTRDRIAHAYPEFQAFDAVRRELDPDGIFLNASLGQLFG
jgi:FAD/FMN-containing dehydrogenase